MSQCLRNHIRLGRVSVMLGVMVAVSSAEAVLPEEAIILGPKLVSTHHVRNLVGPSVQIDDRGVISLAWMEEDHDTRTVFYTRTEQAGGGFRPPVQVNRPEETPYVRQEAPALVVDGDRVFVSWALAHPKASSDKPFANELRLSRSSDGGRTFAPSVRVNDDDQAIPHTFDALHRSPDGTLYISWIDGREGRKEPATFVAQSTDEGQTVGRNQKLDENTCVCCRTALTTGPDGTVYVAWRKIFSGDVRETVVARSTDGGRTFSSPVIVGHDGWVFPGCPHRPASLGVDRQGRLYVVWYTEGADETPAIYLAYSDDQGETFSTKQKLNVSKGTFPDHPQMAVDTAGRVIVVWEEQSPVRREVVVRVSLDRGRTFTATQKLNERKGQSPAVDVNAQGLAVLAWMEHAMPGHKMVVQTLQLPGSAVTGDHAAE